MTSFSASDPLSTPSDLQETVILKNEESLPTLAQTALEHLEELLSENAKGEEDIQMREKRVSCAPEQTKKEDSAGNSSLLGYQTSPLANRSHLSTIFSESELEHELEKDDDIGELSELKSIAEPLDFKKASFSSIASSQGRADFVSALDTINQALEQSRFDRQKTPVASSQPQQGIPSFKSTHIVLLTDSKAQQKMDSPPNDFSPNASPRHGQNMAIPDFSPRDHSNPESIDSTGFEKVERPSDDVLEQYSQNFASQMQQSIFGQLPDDPDCDGFELIEKPKNEMRMGAQGSKIDGQIVEAPGRNENDVQVLERISGDIDAPNAQPMQRPRDDILEKSYGEHPEHGNDDLIDIPRNEQPHQHHDFLDDYQDHPPQPAPRHPTPPRDDFADLLAPVGEIDQHQQQNQQPSPPSPPAYPFHLDYPKETQAHDEDPIREHVEDVHDDVDAMIARMNQNMQEEPEAHPASPSGDSGRDTVGKLLGEDNGPQFGRQTPEELMIDREGPLTIPELPETLPQEDEEDELDAFVRPPSIGHHGFETEPRPPTPPKDISDEDVKPSAIQIPGAHHHHHAHKQHSILKHAGSGPWIDFKTVDPRVLDLIYWRDPKKSGIALALTLIALFILAKYPILSVVTYTSLLVLAGTLGFRIFKAVEAQIKKTEQANPFQPLLDTELSLPQEKVHEQVDVLVEHGQLLATQTRRLFLVESIVDSVKFGLFLWALTYISAWFSGFGLLIVFVLGVFSIPKFYEVYQEPIDQHLSVIKGHIDNVTNIVEEKLPFLKRARVETEKKEQ